MSGDPLIALAKAAGVSVSWKDVFGQTHTVAPPTLRAVLRAVDLPADTDTDIAESMARATKPGGRLVLEMGARGNIARLLQGVEAALREARLPAQNNWYFPSLGEYARLLEHYGFEILHAETFPRWNKLEHPERGLREWLEMFGGAYFDDIPQPQREALITAIEARLKPVLFRDGGWWADYRRLRITGQLG